MLNYTLIAQTLLHPTKKAILENFERDGGKRSPVELAAEIDEPLGNVSYHVNDLAGKLPRSKFKANPVLVAAGTKARRGALEHFYALSPKFGGA